MSPTPRIQTKAPQAMLDQTEAAAKKALAKGAISQELFVKLTDKWIEPQEKAETSALFGAAEAELAALWPSAEPLIRELREARNEMQMHPSSPAANRRAAAAWAALETFDRKSTHPAGEKLILRRDLYLAVVEQASAQRSEATFPALEGKKAPPPPPEVPLGALHVLLKWLQ